jgi:hypothetical protein
MGSGGGHEARGRSARGGDADAATGAGAEWRSSDRRVTFLLMAVEVPIAALVSMIAGRWSRWMPALGTAVVIAVTVISLVLTRIAVG